jgi:hypothetical protein
MNSLIDWHDFLRELYQRVGTGHHENQQNLSKARVAAGSAQPPPPPPLRDHPQISRNV